MNLKNRKKQENMTMMVKPTTTPKTGTPTPQAKPATAKRGATLLKTTLVISSIVATLMGANLAAQRDQSATVLTTTDFTTTASVASAPARIVPGNVFLARPQQPVTVPNLATTDTTIDQLLNPQLAPIPTIKMPTVVTRSRSSR
jgi:hypothetical protein